MASLLLGRVRTPDRLHDRPDSPARVETYQRLAALTGAPVADLYAVTIHRFAPTLSPPTRRVPWLTLPGGMAVALLDTGSMQKRLRRESHGAFCPQCLAEAAYHRLIWTPVASAVCLRHQCLLVDRCPRCGAATAVRAIAAAGCASCGADLTAWTGRSVADDAFGLFAQRVVQAWLLGEPPPHDPAFPLLELPPAVGYRVLDGLRLLAQGAGPDWPYLHPAGNGAAGPAQGFWLTPAQGHRLYATALKALLRWPQGFYAFLDAYLEREAPSNRRRGWLGPRLGALYSTWLGRHWEHVSFAFLQVAFDQYLLDRFGRLHAVSQLGRSRHEPDLGARLPLNLCQAADLIGTTEEMLYRLLQRRRLTRYEAVDLEQPQPPTLVSRTEVLTWRDQPTLAEAAALLGVSYWVLTDLIACGFLPPRHQLADEAPGWRFNRATITACHARVAARVATLPVDTVAAENGYLTLSGAARVMHVLGLTAAALLVCVAEGTLPAYHPATSPVRLRDLRFARADLTAYAERHKAKRAWLSRAEAAQRLGVSERGLHRLVDCGVLMPVPLPSPAYFFERAAVERLRDGHITSDMAAVLLGIGREALLRWTRSGRIQAVSGPGIDDAHHYRFNCSALAEWRAARLTVGEAAALLGVTTSKLAHWTNAGKVAPLADMGGKQRWYARREIVRLRVERSRGAIPAGTGVDHLPAQTTSSRSGRATRPAIRPQSTNSETQAQLQ